MKITTCTADRIARAPVLIATRAKVWHLWRGTARWFICGPGPDAMEPCSAPDYSNRRPKITAREKRTALKALAWLETAHRDNLETNSADIRRILTEAARRSKNPIPSTHDHPSCL